MVLSLKLLKIILKWIRIFGIPLIEDRAFRYICHVYPKVIIKFLAGVCNIDENLIESAYFVDTTMPDLRFNDKKMTVDLLVSIPPEEYINIEANTSNGKSILIKNTNYMFRFILSKQKTGKELKSVKLSQINFDLYSEKFMGGIVNIYTSRNNLNNNILPEMPVVVHIGLDKVYDNPYNENISNWNKRFMKILTSRSIKYTEELAGKYKDLKEVARLMREYSEDTSNLIYYDKEAMDESIRKTDLKFAKEEGYDDGFDSGYDNGVIDGIHVNSMEIAKEMLNNKIDISTIIKCTKLSKEEILKLQKNL